MMKFKHFAGIGAATLLTMGLAVPAVAQSPNAALKGANGQDVGTVSMSQTQAGVLLKVSLKGLPLGEHAFHVHTVGKCDPPSFESAGGHFNPTNAHHGMLSGPGHAGDMPNLHIPPTGTLELEVLNATITLDEGKPNSVFHQGGASAVIHAGKDDYMSDPAGNSGNRITCGVISESPATVGRSPAR